MINAANQSVDFRLLFLGLGFFIIASCFILLIMAVNSFLDSRRSQIYMLFTFGFSDRKINFLLFTENIIISFTGSLAGVFAGIIFNEFLINALNGVWKGAVHTDTIIAVSGINPLLTGFFSAFFAALFLQLIRIKKYLREMHSGKCREFRIPVSRDKIIKFLTIFFIAFGILLTVLNLIFLKEQSLSVSYSSGACLYTGLILLWRLFLIRKASVREEMNTVSFLSRNYYTFYPGRAIMPVLLISAGLFTVTVTGVNRLQVTESSMSVRGGTGGFLLWAETAVPIKENLNLPAGKKVHGLSYHPAETIFYLQAKKLHGDDASCLNLNYITSPSLLGLNPSLLSDRKAFSFATLIKGADPSDPWSMLKKSPAVNTIYGFADQTVLQWGLKKSVGDTLIYRSETGEQLNIIIAGGLKSSVFQGYVITSEDYFSKYFPSVPGYSVFLAGGILELTDDYVKILNARFNNYGIKIMSTKERLERFFEVTNTYLSVFMILGGLGVILGVAGLAFVLRQNYNFRKRDFALMMALGFEEKKIRKIVFSEQVIVLFAGIITGITASLSATFPSIEKGTEIPVRSIALIILAIAITGIATLYFAVRGIKKDYLIHFLRRE
ncbi:MAG: FtsX-like permease family protein [Bacteroidales bacterium]